MGHLPELIRDLALILISAGIFTILFKWLKQPVVLGYIVAGFLAGPHFHSLLADLASRLSSEDIPIASYLEKLPSVSDMANITTWADLGVIFLLFALGLEFSFKKLLKVGGQASIATLISMVSMIVLGFVTGKLLGWSEMDSIFLGAMISMSSTTIIIKVFNDMNLQKTKFANIVFGMLIVEDLAAILILVLLSTFAVNRHFEGREFVGSIVRLSFFIFIWFVVGIYLIPTIFKKLKSFLNDETLLIVATGLCLGMVMFASSVGFSSALGAFIMGSILAETIESMHIEKIVEPLKNFFGAIFFVSVGMMMDPKPIVEFAPIVLLLTAVVMTGLVFFAIVGILASGQGLRVAILSGFSLSQIGEFSFIIATLGMSLGVISDVIYPIIVAVSVITTFATPYLIKAAPSVADYLESHVPARFNRLVTGYATSDYKVVNKQNEWNRLLKNILIQVAIYFTISVAVMLICKFALIPFVTDNISGFLGRLVAAVLTLTLMSPFIRAMVMKKNTSEEFKTLWADGHFNQGALISMIILRIALAVALVSTVLFPLFETARALLIVIALTVIIGFLYSRNLKKQSRRIEARFLENFTQKQIYDEKRAAIPSKVASDMLAKDIHIEEFEISPNSPIIGKTLQELQFKQRTGVSVITILRGNRKINIPGAREYIYPCDKIVVSGSDEELKRLDAAIGTGSRSDEAVHEEIPQHHINLSQFEIESDSPFVGKTIGDLRLREKTETLIVAIERDGKSIVDFHADFKFCVGDTLLIAGEQEKLDRFVENIIAK